MSLTPSIVTGSLSTRLVGGSGDFGEDDCENDDVKEVDEAEDEDEDDEGADVEESISVLISKMIPLHFKLVFTVPMFFALARS